MSSKGQRRKFKRIGGGAKSSRKVTLNGDHGTGMQAANHNTMLEPIADSPNNMGQRKRINRIEWLMARGWLNIRQYQAAQAIEDAYAQVESLSSGSELKEQVQSSPKPDAVIAAQCDANSRLTHVMKPVLKSQRKIVEHVCWHNLPMSTIAGPAKVRSAHRLRDALNLVADHLQY
jgi:hypothetical protein